MLIRLNKHILIHYDMYKISGNVKLCIIYDIMTIITIYDNFRYVNYQWYH